AGWLVPQPGQGRAEGAQTLRVRIDGGQLGADRTAVGTVTVTDLASGRKYPVVISAKIGRLFEFSAERIVLNVPLGKQAAREGMTLLNNSAQPLKWRAEGAVAWLRMSPGGGTIPPGELTFLTLRAAPPDRQAARHETALTLTVGRASKKIPVTAYVIAPYARPAAAKGKGIWLLDALERKLIAHASHTTGGYNHAENAKLPPAKRKVPEGWWQARPIYAGKLPGGFGDVYGLDERKWPFRLGRRRCLRGLWGYPYHQTTYDLTKADVRGFSAWVGFNPGMQKGKWPNRAAVLSFEAYVDGVLAAQSGLMRVTDEPRQLSVEGLAKAKRLQLVIRHADGGNDLRALGTWGDPTLYFDAPPEPLAALRRKELALWTDPPLRAIDEWAFIGPWPRTDGEDAFPAAKKLDFTATYRGVGDKPIAWRKVSCDADGVLRLEKVLADTVNTTSYCAVSLKSPRRQVAQFGMGAGGRWSSSVRIWLNGRHVYGKSQHVGGPKKNVHRFVAVLDAGVNLLLVRLDEAADVGGLVVTCRGEGVQTMLPKDVK
ncbi:hypothetical protein LCGC14_1665260, partial [marine sediment metagenome]